MKKYLWNALEIETNLKEEEDYQNTLEKKQKKLKELVYDLEEKVKKIDAKISNLEYKVIKNNYFMEKFNKNYLTQISRMTFTGATISMLGTLFLYGGLSNAFNFYSLIGSIGASGAISYTFYSIFTNTLDKKKQQNEEYIKEIKELTEEKDEFLQEINLSKEELKKIKKELIKSEEKTKELEKQLELTVNIWNEELNKPTANDEKKVKESASELKQYVLKKKIPKELYDEFEEEEKNEKK